MYKTQWKNSRGTAELISDQTLRAVVLNDTSSELTTFCISQSCNDRFSGLLGVRETGGPDPVRQTLRSVLSGTTDRQTDRQTVGTKTHNREENGKLVDSVRRGKQARGKTSDRT